MFFFKFLRKKKRQPRRRPVAPSDEKRSAFRMPVEFDVHYMLPDSDEGRAAKANELSAGGLRLLCGEELESGVLVRLEFELPADFLPSMTVEKELYDVTPFGLRPETIKVQPPGFAPMDVSGRVLAASFNGARGLFEHGIAFAGMDTKVEEELQRFMHLWQVHFLRTRHGDLD